MNGKCFTSHVKDGDCVKKGKSPLEFDLKAIIKTGYDPVAPIVVTNSSSYVDVVGTKESTVTEKDMLLEVLSE